MLEFENDIEDESELLRWLYFYIEKKSEKGVNKKHISKMISKIEEILNVSFNDGFEPPMDSFESENKVDNIF